LEVFMAKKWEQMTKNEKLDTLRADVAKIADALSKLTRRSEAAAPAVPKKVPKKAPKKVKVRKPRPSARTMKPKADARLPAPAEEEAKAN
jgi:uncharacterized protein YoxC